jgi:hypothetical protein
MDIRPIDSKKVDGATTRHTKDLEPIRPEKSETSPTVEKKPARDEIEISQVARDLIESGEPGTDSIEPDRLHEILDRIRNHFYESPDVRGMVLQLIAQDIQPGFDA